MTSRDSGSSSGTTTAATRGASSAIKATRDMTDAELAAPSARLEWRVAKVVGTRDQTPSTRALVLDVPGWPGHRAGQHVDVRLVAEAGYQARRSYSIAWAQESGPRELHSRGR